MDGWLASLLAGYFAIARKLKPEMVNFMVSILRDYAVLWWWFCRAAIATKIINEVNLKYICNNNIH